MLPLLSRTARWRAGWVVSLAYLFCVLAPSLSFALANGSSPAPCIVEDHGSGMHKHDSAIHDHMKHASNADQKVHSDATVPVKGQQKAADTRCCGLVSISAMPASEIAIAVPPALESVCETETYRDAADNAPSRHYRPPIS